MQVLLFKLILTHWIIHAGIQTAQCGSKEFLVMIIVPIFFAANIK